MFSKPMSIKEEINRDTNSLKSITKYKFNVYTCLWRFNYEMGFENDNIKMKLYRDNI